jgi:hypothetical protein
MENSDKEILSRLLSLRGYAMSLKGYDRFDVLVEAINKLINHYNGKAPLSTVSTGENK